MSWQPVDAPVLLAMNQIHRFFRNFIFHFRAHCTDCQQVARWKMVCESVIDVSSGENRVKGSQHIFHRIKHWATRCYAQKWKMKDVLTQKLQICAKRHVTHTRKTAKRYAENRLSACKRQYLHPVWRPSLLGKITLPDLKKYHKSLCSFPFCPKFMIIRQA